MTTLPPAEVEALRDLIRMIHPSAYGALAYDKLLALLASHEALRAQLAEYREAVRDFAASGVAGIVFGGPYGMTPDHPEYAVATRRVTDANAALDRLRALAERDTPPAKPGAVSP